MITLFPQKKLVKQNDTDVWYIVLEFRPGWKSWLLGYFSKLGLVQSKRFETGPPNKGCMLNKPCLAFHGYIQYLELFSPNTKVPQQTRIFGRQHCGEELGED